MRFPARIASKQTKTQDMKILSIKKKSIMTEIKNALENGQVLVLPCDTVYGLFCHAENQKSINKIFEIKGRDSNKPIGIYVKNIAMAKVLARINKAQEKILQKYWPGKVTFILRKKQGQLKNVGAETTIGIRIPDYKLFQNLLEQIDFPLAQTSANISNQPAITKVQEIIDCFENQKQKPDLVIDAGDLPEAQPSTVADLTSEKPKILRQGEIKIE